MRKWEYQRMIIIGATGLAIDGFNELGSDGWELVSVSHLRNDTVSVAFFKREIGTEPREVRRTCCKEDHDHFITGTHPPH